MTWYRQYRPQTVSGLHITSVRHALDQMLKSGNIPHALLFAGTKGTGKTSSARIIAKVLNCEQNSKRKSGQPYKEPCNTCAMCIEITKGSSLNVTEMDGASNRRIDDIRQLKERLYIPPAQGMAAVYIIDEVHMLTKEAFNALLKMLEEPPTHVYFVFATTDPQKIPDTILSRCTRVQFTQATIEELTQALRGIAENEKIEVEPEALSLIAQRADGSFRDAVKLFEQLAQDTFSNKSTLTLSYVEQNLSAISAQNIAQLFAAILQKDEQQIITFFRQMIEASSDAHFVHKQILGYLHAELMKVYGGEAAFTKVEVIFYFLKQFSAVVIPLQHPFPLLPLELCALEMVIKSKEKQGSPKAAAQPPRPTTKTASQTHTRPSLLEKSETSTVSSVSTPLQDDPTPQQEPQSEPEISVSSADGKVVGEKWQELLKMVGKKNLSLEAILRSAQFVDGHVGKATVKVFYGFHKDQLELQRYRTIIEESVQQLAGGLVRFEYVLSTGAAKQLHNENSNVEGKMDEGLVSTIEEALL